MAVGRIAAFVDRSHRDHAVMGDIAWVGLLESIDDDTDAETPLGAATRDLERTGAVKKNAGYRRPGSCHGGRDTART
ncbi:hypothetical protein LLF88_07405 [bacterium]|nr:hypothetical protein [bacterium]